MLSGWKFPLLFILLLAAFLRLWRLDSNPPGLFFDEASTGYDALCILETGKDQWGFSFPLFFPSWGDFKEGLYRYSTVPFVAVMGSSALTVRLPNALYGLATVLFAALLGRLWFGHLAGLAAGLLLAISPWHLAIGREGMRIPTLPLVFTAALFTFAKALQEPVLRPKWLTLSAFLFGLCFYTYSSSRAFIPLFVSLLFGLNRKVLLARPKALALSLGCFAVVSLPLLNLYFFHRDWFFARYADIGLGSRASDMLGKAGFFFENLLRYYDPRFLFFQGNDNSYFRFDQFSTLPGLTGFGEVHRFLIPFLLMGLWKLFREGGSRRWLFLGWFLMFPVSGASVVDSVPNNLRGVTLFPWIELMGGLGVATAWSLAQQEGWRRIALWGWGFLGACEATAFIWYYFVVYPALDTTLNCWQWGYREMVTYAIKEQGAYDEVVFSATFWRPMDQVRFLTRVDPRLTQHYRGDIPAALFPYRQLPPEMDLQTYFQTSPLNGLFFTKPGEISGAVPVRQFVSPGGEVYYEAYRHHSTRQGQP